VRAPRHIRRSRGARSGRQHTWDDGTASAWRARYHERTGNIHMKTLLLATSQAPRHTRRPSIGMAHYWQETQGSSMEDQTIVQALLLGILEGLTEFIPVSSTGHLLLSGHFLGFESTGKSFEVLIQLDAILAILSVYFGRLWTMLVSLPSDRGTQHFVGGILLAFLPAAIIGALAHGFIKTVLFESPMLIS